MKDRIEKLERLILKFKNQKKIDPKFVERLEWELRALKAESKLQEARETMTFVFKCTDVNFDKDGEIVGGITCGRSIGYGKPDLRDGLKRINSFLNKNE